LGIAVDTDGQKIYWTDLNFPPKIQRANPDGTDIEVLITTELSPKGIALDTSEQKIYWTNPEASKIQRSNFDGTNIEDIPINGLCAPYGLDLDTNGGKIYWTDGCTGIHRSNLDGTGVEMLVAKEIAYPNDVAVDVNNGKIYWTNHKARKIQRANLDGTNVEDLVELPKVPKGIALDVKEGKIYLTETHFNTGAGIILRLNLDGTEPQTVLKPANIQLEKTRLSGPLGIAVDPYGGKIYWTDLNPGRIHRANLNGTDAEDFLTGIIWGRFIALDLTQAIESLSVVNHQGKQPTLWGRIRGNALLQNFPNPFNPETWIPYQLAEAAHVRIRIYDALGHLVRELDLGKQPAGDYLSRQRAVYWDGRNDMGEVVSSGVYFYTLVVEDYQETRRMTVVR
jgi:sugar lactone lactonase YvrE